LASGDLPFNDPATAKLQDLIRMNLSSSYAMYSQDNEVDIYTDGREMLDRILQSIGEAKHYVHIMFYILRDDRTGRSLIQALTRKARESVEIRLLYDAIGSISTPATLFKPLLEAGGKVGPFFPSPIPYLNIRINYRNHRKLVIVDSIDGYI